MLCNDAHDSRVMYHMLLVFFCAVLGVPTPTSSHHQALGVGPRDWRCTALWQDDTQLKSVPKVLDLRRLPTQRQFWLSSAQNTVERVQNRTFVCYFQTIQGLCFFEQFCDKWCLNDDKIMSNDCWWALEMIILMMINVVQRINTAINTIHTLI